MINHLILFSLILHKNFDLLLIACNLIFTGSWANEILLDIRDYEGDNQQGVATLPTTLGKQSSWTIALLILYIGMATNSMTMGHLFNLKISSLFLLLTTPQLYYFFNIIKNDYSHKSIETYMKHSNKTLVAILLFIHLIAFIHFIHF
jgi:4-hydroxybenzoate polyprenyltransferase